MVDLNPATISAIVDTLRTAKRLLFITGAGISADSGLPTYRGIGGLYNDPTTEDAVPIETALSGSMLKHNPAITWKYLSQIEQSCRGARFNTAHAVIAQWQARFDVCVLTQNIDGFHRDAGSRHLIEVHGDLHDLLCTRCPWSATVVDYSDVAMPPTCPQCGAPVRPRVVLFGEMLPPGALQALQAALDQGFDMVFSIGTTSVFPYIAGPVVHAYHKGVPTVEINPSITHVTDYIQHKLTAGAAESLRALNNALNG